MCLLVCLLVCLFVCLIVVVSLYIRNIPTHFFSNENGFDDRRNREIIDSLHAALEEKEKTIGNLRQINSTKDSVFAVIKSKLEKLKEGLDTVTDENNHVRVSIK